MRIPLGQLPSLHCLRRRSTGFVRLLLRYYEAVRLPNSVLHRRVSSDFPGAAWRLLLPQAVLGSPGSRAKCFHACLGSTTAQDQEPPRLTATLVLPSPCVQKVGILVDHSSHEWGSGFRSSIPSLHLPLSTLRPRPYGRDRMTRGRCGSLLLHPYDSFIHYTLPVSRRYRTPALPVWGRRYATLAAWRPRTLSSLPILTSLLPSSCSWSDSSTAKILASRRTSLVLSSGFCSHGRKWPNQRLAGPQGF